MSELRFAEPGWVDAFWALAAFAVGLVLLERRGGRALERLVSPVLAARLVERPAPWRRQARVALLLLCFAATIVALMRPQWGLRYVPASRVGAELMICLDVSRSMLAEDVAPNRLERAKAELVDLLALLEGDEVGLIAFAGRSTVLSPLTPDFSFLRLVLEGAGPGSVGRGGTRLEEPLRKALAGLAAASGSAARAILLITDGEDLDSFPLEAARAAREAGVRVIAIGFGSETGSQIYVTDPRTGARTLLRDAQGEPVVSRLGGETLRDIVREAGGAYVPAGTGVLDLEAIYREHIAGLLRGELSGRGRPLREEGYPWALLVALLGLLGSVAVSSRADPVRAERDGVVRAAAVLLALALLWTPARAWTQEGVGTQEPPAAADPAAPDAAPAPEAAAEPSAAPAEAAPVTPRERYNQSLASLRSGDLDSAERALRAARAAGAEDGELRFRSSYNLGVAAALRAEAQREKDPQGALAQLYESADRFREAVRQQPEDLDSRHNLEVALQRALVLADEIARRGAADLPARIDALIERERGVAERAAALLAGDVPDADLVRRRGEHRVVSGDQRVLLADCDALAREIAAERDGLKAHASDPDAPADGAARAALLDRVLEHLYAARGHMGAARSQLRLLQSERAYRRASAALGDLKRARDPLRDPAQVLEELVREALEIGGQASVLAQPTPAPPWLSGALLEQSETALADRTAELAQRLGESTGDDGQGAEAGRFVAEGESAFRQGAMELQGQRFGDALEAQRRGIETLLEARERLLALKALLELVYRDERTLQTALGEKPAAGASELPLPALQALQKRNGERGGRLATLLEREKARSESPATEGAAANPDAAQLDALRKRVELAEPLLQRARARMDGATALLAKGQKGGAREAATAAVKELAQLRRLFFSIAEQVRESAERQIELGDDTRDLGALARPEELRERAQPLAQAQGELADRTAEIANALEEQSRQSVGGPAEEPQAGQASDRLRMAAERVLAAEKAMRGAVGAFARDPVGLEDAKKAQQSAVEALAEALKLLTPPGESPPKSDSQKNQESEQEQPQNQAGSGSADRSEGAQDPAQMLQSVRDRDAQRRRAQARRQGGGNEPVERDW